MYSTDNGAEKFTWPILVNLRADPYETAWKESAMYIRWFADNMWTFVPAQAITGEFLKTFSPWINP